MNKLLGTNCVVEDDDETMIDEALKNSVAQMFFFLGITYR